MPLTPKKLSNLSDNYQRILSIIKNEPVGDLHQALNRLAFNLSKATESSTINTETEQRINYLFEKYFTPEFTRFTQTAEESSQRVFREFDRLVEQHQKENPHYNLENIDDRKNILSALITNLGCFPHTWAQSQPNPNFPTSSITTINDVLYVDCGPKKLQKRLSGPEKTMPTCFFNKFSTGEFLNEILQKKMAFLLPVLTPSRFDTCYWDNEGEQFPVNDENFITIKYLDIFLRDNSKRTLAQKILLTLCNQDGDTLDTHTLWFSHLKAQDEMPFNLDEVTRNLFRWLFQLLLDGKKGRVHCSSSIGRTGMFCLAYKSYADFIHQPENYALLTRFLHGEELNANECQQIAMVLVHSLDALRQIRPFIQSPEQLITTPGQLFLMMAEEFPVQNLDDEDILQLQTVFVPEEKRYQKTKLELHQELPDPDDEDALTTKEQDDKSSVSLVTELAPTVAEKYSLEDKSDHKVLILPARFSPLRASAPHRSLSVADLLSCQDPANPKAPETQNSLPIEIPTHTQTSSHWLSQCWARIFSCCHPKKIAPAEITCSKSIYEP